MLTVFEIEKEILKNEEKYTFQGFKINDLRIVFEKIQNKENWKREWAAYVPPQLVPIVSAAVEFFHADKVELHKPRSCDGFILISGNGYQAW